MGNAIIHDSSIAHLTERLGLGQPAHPLIAIIDTSVLAVPEEAVGNKLISDMYCIAMKDPNCGLDYGRNAYDFTSGSMLFTAPGQAITLTRAHEANEIGGWLLYVHPDLIRNTALGSNIDSYSFFDYDVYEALHLSEQEEQTMNQCLEMIRHEINQRIDNHSREVLVANLELMLKYASRFYERQFNTRAAQNTDVAATVERLLKAWYSEKDALEGGQPSIHYLAEACNVSPSYLSDLLKKATGRTAKDHINDFIINKAKTLLLSSTDSISGVAYQLGFNYPHYFSRLFKTKTGMTPQAYRDTKAA